MLLKQLFGILLYLGVANDIKHSLDQTIARCSLLNILHWRNLQKERKKFWSMEISFISKICTPWNQIEEDHSSLGQTSLLLYS